MIETRLLRQFIVVAEELHFRRAAERLHMAQPPLSQAIRRLEAEIGFSLFERNNRNVSLTPAGAAFLQKARAILSAFEEAVSHARRVAEGADGHLTISFINITPYLPVLRALRNFRCTAPDVVLTLKEAATHEQIQSLENGEADLGFLRTPGTAAPNLHFEEILREPVCVALPSGHPLASDQRIELKQLRDEPFVASPRPLGQGFHDQLIELCQAAGFMPQIVQEARRIHTLVGLVASGFGVALLPASLTSEIRQDVVFRSINVDAPEELRYLGLQMAWNRSHSSPARDRFVEEVRRLVKQRQH